jgi:hypothetical protein
VSVVLDALVSEKVLSDDFKHNIMHLLGKVSAGVDIGNDEPVNYFVSNGKGASLFSVIKKAKRLGLLNNSSFQLLVGASAPLAINAEQARKISEEEKSSFRNMCLMLNVDEDEIEGVINSGHDLKQVLNEVITLHGYLSWSVEKLSDLACTLVNKYIAGQSSAIGLMNQFVSLQVRGKLFKKGWRQLWLILQKVIVIFVRLLQASRIYWLVRSL